MTRTDVIRRGRMLAVNRFADWEISKAWWQVVIQRGLTKAQKGGREWNEMPGVKS